jgi:hypothetical protein
MALLAYGLWLGRLGFYRDDWYQIWSGLTLGYRSIITLFSIDRPVMGYSYAAAFYFLRESPLAWQVYALFLRWLGALGALWFLRRMWPARPVMTTSAAVLFLIYPGFLQQPNANTFSNHLSGYAAGILSLAATVEALHSVSRRRLAFTALAVVGGLTCWLIYEYMIGLEGIRYLVLALESRKSVDGPRGAWISRGLARSLPYLVPLLGYLTWRLFLFRAGRGSVDVPLVLSAYAPSPVALLLQRALELVKDFLEASFLGWSVPLYDRLSSIDLEAFAWGLVPASLACLAFLIYVRAARPAAHDETEGDERPARVGVDVLLFGAFSTMCALTPVILFGRDIRWSSAFDRYTLHATLGLGMLAVGLVFGLVRTRARPAVLAFLIGLSVLSHQANAAHWARFWEEQRTLWWQLTWRAPGLESGTVLVVNLPSQRYFEDYEVWGPANLIFDPGREQPAIAAQVLEEETARNIRASLQEVRSMRVLIAIPRDFSKTLLVEWPSTDSCVHVLEGVQPEVPAASGSLVRSIAGYSRGDLILADVAPARPPERIFGREPVRGWCWFYQTGALARQARDWPRVAEIAQEAERLNLTPLDPSEWMPFFQGYVNLGDEARARRLADLIRDDAVLQQELCSQLSGVYFLDHATFEQGRQLLCH